MFSDLSNHFAIKSPWKIRQPNPCLEQADCPGPNCGTSQYSWSVYLFNTSALGKPHVTTICSANMNFWTIMTKWFASHLVIHHDSWWFTGFMCFHKFQGCRWPVHFGAVFQHCYSQKAHPIQHIPCNSCEAHIRPPNEEHPTKRPQLVAFLHVELLISHALLWAASRWQHIGDWSAENAAFCMEIDPADIRMLPAFC